MKDKRQRLERRKRKIRGKINKEGYRLAVSRSNRFLFAQIIDQKTGKTILGGSDRNFLSKEEAKGKTKTQKAALFGQEFAKKILEAKIKKAVFDRGGYKYHGRVKAFAEGIREGGVEL